MNNNNYRRKDTSFTYFMVELIITKEDYENYQKYSDLLDIDNMTVIYRGGETLSLMITFGSYENAFEDTITILKITKTTQYTVNFYIQDNSFCSRQFYFESNYNDEPLPDMTNDDGTFNKIKSMELLQLSKDASDVTSSNKIKKPIKIFDPVKKIPNFSIKFGTVVAMLINDLEDYNKLCFLKQDSGNGFDYDCGVSIITKTGKYRLMSCSNPTIWLFNETTQRVMKYNDCRKPNTDNASITSIDIKPPSIFVGSSYREVIDNLKTDDRIGIYIDDIIEYTDPEYGQGYLINIKNVEIVCYDSVTSIANLISQKLHKKPLDYSLFISQIENGRLKVDDEMYIDLYTEVYNVE